MKPPSKTLEPLLAKARASLAYDTEGAKLEFTEQIVALMEATGVTKSTLAARLGVAPAYVTKVLRGATNFTLDSMVKLARALNADLYVELRPRKATTAPSASRSGKVLSTNGSITEAVTLFTPNTPKPAEGFHCEGSIER